MSRVLVEVLRGGIRESTHSGWIAVVDAQGRAVAGIAFPYPKIFARSTLKPFQALAFLLSGAAERFALTDQELAIICSSHSGEEGHVTTVQRLLDRAGLSMKKLRCGAHEPLHSGSADELRRAGRPPSTLHNNCSGKHAGMLLLCSHQGWPVIGYLDPGHPAQFRIREILVRFFDLPAEDLEPALDGCSAPVYAVPLAGLAHAYARLANPVGLPRSWRSSARRLLRAMTANPWFVAGTDRLDTALMKAVPGIVAKGGSEGVHAVALPERGWGMATKIADGQQRAVGPAVVEALRQLKILDDPGLKALEPFHRPLLRNHRGLIVGQIRPRFRLAKAGATGRSPLPN